VWQPAAASLHSGCLTEATTNPDSLRAELRPPKAVPAISDQADEAAPSRPY
jgi:hypothetical protein